MFYPKINVEDEFLCCWMKIDWFSYYNIDANICLKFWMSIFLTAGETSFFAFIWIHWQFPACFLVWLHDIVSVLMILNWTVNFSLYAILTFSQFLWNLATLCVIRSLWKSGNIWNLNNLKLMGIFLDTWSFLVVKEWRKRCYGLEGTFLSLQKGIQVLKNSGFYLCDFINQILGWNCYTETRVLCNLCICKFGVPWLAANTYCSNKETL